MTAILHIRDLELRHGAHSVFSAASLRFARGEFTAIIGPNGAGKSSLLNALSGKGSAAGAVYHQEQPLSAFDGMALARQRAVLGQQSSIAFALSVAELVRLGREAYRGQAAQAHDSAVCRWAMQALDLQTLGTRSSAELSGGEQQRAHIARVLAQLLPSLQAGLHGKWLLLDEPTNHLDIRHQYRLFALLQLLKARGLSIIAVLHDPALAINQAGRILMLKAGRVFGEYAAAELAQSPALDVLYEMPMRCRYCRSTRQYYLVPQLAEPAQEIR